MSPLSALLMTVLIPALCAAVVIILLRRPWRPDSLSAPGRAPGAAGLAIAAAFAVTFALLLGWPALPPVDATQWAAWLVPVAGGLCLVQGPRRGPWRLMASAVLGVATAWTLLAPLAANAWTTSTALLAIAAAAATVPLVDTAWTRAASGLGPRTGAASLSGVLAVLAAVAALSGTASIGQLAGGAAAASGALLALGLWRPELASVRAAGPVVAVLYAWVAWSSFHYAVLPAPALAALLAAPLFWLGAPRAALALRSRLAAFAVPVALAVTPVVVGAGLAALSYFAEPAPAAPSDADPAPDGEATYDYDYGY